MKTKPRCVLCGRPAQPIPGLLHGTDYAEPYGWCEGNDDHDAPLCHECALSAYYQGGLWWGSDSYRILGTFGDSDAR